MTRVAAERGHDFGGGHESIRVVTAVVVAGQPGLPVRGEQPQARPALGTPRVRHLTSLEDDVVDRTFGEAVAHGQPGVASADNDRSGLHNAAIGPCWSGQLDEHLRRVGYDVEDGRAL